MSDGESPATQKRKSRDRFDSRLRELGVLGFCLVYPERFYEVSSIGLEAIQDTHIRNALKVIWDDKTLRGEGVVHSEAAMADALSALGFGQDQAFALITEAIDHAPRDPSGIVAIREAILNDQTRRHLALVATTIGEIAKTTIPRDQAIDEALTAIHAASNQTVTTKVHSMAAAMEEEIVRMDMLEKGIDTRKKGLETGLEALDAIIGGLRGGELIVVAARPSMGKSALVTRIVETLACDRGVPGVVFSLEMGQREYAQRAISSMANVDISRAVRGMLSPGERQQYRDAAKIWAGQQWYCVDEAQITMPRMSAAARQLYHQHGARWLVLDYLQLMDHQKRDRESDNSAIARTSNAIKRLARELDVPAIVLSQLNRGPDQRENHRPRMSDLRDSGAIEQDADVILFVYRESQYLDADRRKELEGQEFEKAELIVAKQRNGPLGTARVAFYAKNARFDNWPMHGGYGDGYPEGY